MIGHRFGLKVNDYLTDNKLQDCAGKWERKSLDYATLLDSSFKGELWSRGQRHSSFFHSRDSQIQNCVVNTTDKRSLTSEDMKSQMNDWSRSVSLLGIIYRGKNNQNTIFLRRVLFTMSATLLKEYMIFYLKKSFLITCSVLSCILYFIIHTLWLLYHQVAKDNNQFIKDLKICFALVNALTIRNQSYIFESKW